MTDLFERYESALIPHREAFRATTAVGVMSSPSTSDDRFARWMLQFCARGTSMTAPVESWIAEVGRRCEEIGMTSVGRAMAAHSRAEAGHDALMVADAIAIGAWLDEHDEAHPDVEELLAEPPLASSLAYRKLHEDVIGGPAPFAQLAIEYEIELLSITIGPPMLRNCQRIFGSDSSRYTFLAEHVELDAGHTAFNRRQLTEVLLQAPDALPTLIETGRAALECYSQYMAQCLHLADGALV
jgi:hypothetical protein